MFARRGPSPVSQLLPVLLLLALPVLLIPSCGPAPTPAPPVADPDTSGSSPSSGDDAGGAPRQSGRDPLDPARILPVRFPAGTRVIASGAFGPDALPVVWYRLELPGVAPEEAVRRVIAAIEAIGGTVDVASIASDEATGAAIGQWRSSTLAAVATGRAAGTAAAVRLTVEVKR